MSEYWIGKRVCVTGGAGFVGSQLVEELIGAGARVAVLDNWSRGKFWNPDANHVNGDATNPATLSYAFNPRWVDDEDASIGRAKVDVVFNLAATVAGVLHNMNHHHQMFRENANLQVVPLMVAEQLEIPVFVQVSSVCIYDPAYNHPSVESATGPEPHPANAGYAWAKRMGERALMWGEIERGVIVRPSNIFGPRDYFDDKAHVIPAVIKRAFEDPVIHMYGPKSVTREFIYSRDVALGMMAAAEHGENKQAYNLGANGDPENVISMEDLATAVMSAIGGFKDVVWHEDVGGGDPDRYSDCQRANSKLGWKHTVGIHDGLKQTVKWYEKKRDEA